MKRCKIAPPSCTRRDRPCCADCPDKTCVHRCWNSPGRCGCWTEGPPPRKRGDGKGGGRLLDWDGIARLHGLGLSQRNIANLLDCAPGTVCNALKKMGVSGRGQS